MLSEIKTLSIKYRKFSHVIVILKDQFGVNFLRLWHLLRWNSKEKNKKSSRISLSLELQCIRKKMISLHIVLKNLIIHIS